MVSEISDICQSVLAMKLVLFYGNAVAGEQRFDRPALQDKLLRQLGASGGIKMFGLRRIGKSTLRRYVVETLHSHGRPVAFIDAQGLHGVADLLGALLCALPKESGVTSRALGLIAKDSPIRSVLEALASGTKTGEKVVSAYWREAYNSIRNALTQPDAMPILVIDEFSLLLKNMLDQQPGTGTQEVNQLLAALREWRDKGMKMLLTGSVGVTALARRHNPAARPPERPAAVRRARAHRSRSTRVRRRCGRHGHRWEAGRLDRAPHRGIPPPVRSPVSQFPSQGAAGTERGRAAAGSRGIRQHLRHAGAPGSA
jgi:hypothetical protein